MTSMIGQLSSCTDSLAQTTDLNYRRREITSPKLHNEDNTKVCKVIDSLKLNHTCEPSVSTMIKGRVKEKRKNEHGNPGSLKRELGNPFKKIPPFLIQKLLSFLPASNIVALRTSCMSTYTIQKRSSKIIETHGLKPLIETYLHGSLDNLSESQLAVVNGRWISLCHQLSTIEDLPRPSYRSMPEFFKLIEARNLIRMFGKISEDYIMIEFGEAIENFTIPQDQEQALEKARLLRLWIEEFKDFIENLDDTLDLIQCRLSLLPKEIGCFKKLRGLLLSKNKFVTLPKELSSLQSLETIEVDPYLLTLKRKLDGRPSSSKDQQ